MVNKLRTYLRSDWVIPLFAATLCSGCTTTTLHQLTNTSPQGSDFTAALAREYLSFASSEGKTYYDQISAHYFARKGLDAALGTEVQPEPLEHWSLPKDKVGEIAAARERLRAALNSKAKSRGVNDLAIAQARFDCWVEEQDENKQPANIERCRAQFYQAVEQAEKAARSGDFLIPTAPYSVYYKTGKTDVPAEAQQVLDQLMALIQQQTDFRVVVDGYADRTGKRARNLEISEKRAYNMKTAIAARGVAHEKVKTFGHGDSSASGKKGIPNARDRRVDISLYVPEDSLVNMGQNAPAVQAAPTDSAVQTSPTLTK